eukprot:TRINITY_DN3318_c0_g2_i1.p1 TRINITY_DN3318_c0_g2~~TRINITY_DN3318_c0_g2_i1.p1  ORF type:complete len:675 (-),score=159.34 TRINITY_DN3318_c0_g2_i1:158-1915(-)
MAEGFDLFWIRTKLFFTLPWNRVKKGSLLTLKLSGQIGDQFEGRFSRSVSLPQLCQNLRKAAHDPRIMGVFIKIEPLQVGWGKIDEIVRHIEYFRQSGKLCMAYMAVGGEKEYYVACACGEIYVPPEGYVALRGLTVGGTFLGGALEKLGVEAQVQRLGKYKSAGDVFSRTDMSEANREQLSAILDDIFYNWVDYVAASRGKTRADVEALLDAGVLTMKDLKEAGWVSDTKYEDELEEKLKELTGGKKEKVLTVDYRKYSRVKESTLGLAGRGEMIAIVRASGGISRGGGGRSVNMSDSITSEALIKKIRQVKENKKYKALVLRIDSPGGDALASDLMWRELRLLSEKIPVVASMVDVAASGGYYMAMATNAIVAEPLTLTGSIGVITLKLNLANLYERIGLSKEIISRGRFAELDADNRPFRPEEAEYFAKSAQNFYESFRGKAAASRGMPVEKMEEVAQGRVWTGKAAKDRGLVDYLGGMPTAIAIAKHKAGISEDTKVRLVELSRKEASLTSLLGAGAFMFGALGGEGTALWESFTRVASFLDRLQSASASEGPQAVMDDIWVDGLGLNPRANAGRDNNTSS